MFVTLDGKRRECTYDFKRCEWWLIIVGVVLRIKIKTPVRNNRRYIQKRASEEWELYKRSRNNSNATLQE